MIHSLLSWVTEMLWGVAAWTIVITIVFFADCPAELSYKRYVTSWWKLVRCTQITKL